MVETAGNFGTKVKNILVYSVVLVDKNGRETPFR